MKQIRCGLGLVISIVLMCYAETASARDTFCKVSGNPSYPGGFYGSDNGKTAGADAFEKVLSLLKSLSPQGPYEEDPKQPRPMMLLIYGKNSCTGDCDAFVEMFKEYTSSGSVKLILGTVNGYFRGSDEASQDAKAFFVNKLKNSGSCHLIGFYGIAGNGKEYISSTSLSSATTWKGFQSLITAQKKAWATFKEKNPFVPSPAPKASAAFACRQQSLAEGVAPLYVPLVRTNCLNKAEKNGLKVVRDGATVSTTNFTWATSGAAAERMELPFKLDWAKDAQYQVILINTNNQEVATNTITCVAAEANGFANPRYIGETNGYAFGEWTLDLAVATNAVAAKAALPMVAVKAYTLAVSGSSTTDAKLAAFAQQVFASAAFTTWATNNNVATVLLDRPMSGNSILNHTHDNDDACYISLKGLRAYMETVPAAGDTVALSAEAMMDRLETWDKDYRKDSGSEEAEYILIRPNGSVAGRLAPQMTYDTKTKAWVCDVEENVARLAELLKEVDDLTEEANGSAKTPLTFDWPATVSQVETNGQTLSVNDTEDWLRLTGEGWAGKKVLGVAKNGTPGLENLRLEVVVKGQVVEPTVEYIVKNNEFLCETNYEFKAEDVATNAVFVKAVAYEGAAATKFGGDTRFGYTITARPIKEAPGVVSFAGESATVISEETNKTYRVGLVRLLGYSGAVSATVRVNELLTTATNLYEYVDQTVTWEDSEGGTNDVRYVYLTLKGTNACDGVKTIVLTNGVTVSGVDEKIVKLYEAFSISYGQNPTNAGEMGILIYGSTPAMSDDGRVYVRYDETNPELLRVNVYRTGGMGEATGTLTVKSGSRTIDTETLTWENYATGNKTMIWDYEDLPEPSATRGYADATVKLTSTIDVAEGYDALSVRVLAKDAPKFEQESVSWGDAVQYVVFSNAVDVIYGGQGLTALPVGWTVQGATKISGAVPTGLKVSADKATGALVVTGTPTAATEEPMTSIWWMKFKDDQGDVVMSSPVTLTITVKALAKTDVNPEGLIPGFESARAWTGLPLVDKETKRLAGLLDMTVAKNGRTTAKWRKAGGKNVSFSAASLTGCVQSEGETNVYVNATKTAREGTSRTVNEFTVTFWADGAIEGKVVECDGAGAVVTEARFEVPAAEVWSKEHTAAAWEGNYTLAFPHDDAAGAFDNNTLCFGATSLRVKFTSDSQFKTGKATFAGYLPNGRSVSGTAAFVPAANGAEVATLPIFYSTSADTFGAVIDVSTNEVGDIVSPSETATNFWQHVESGLPGASYTNDYAALGTRYKQPEDYWQAAWETAYGTNTLGFVAGGENGMVPFDTGARVAAKGATLKVADKGELKTLAFSLNKTSGLATGTFRDGADAAATREPIAEGKTATWRGVALPGTDPSAPFMTGAYWYTKVYVDEPTGKKRSVKAGGAVSLEPVPAE